MKTHEQALTEWVAGPIRFDGGKLGEREWLQIELVALCRYLNEDASEIRAPNELVSGSTARWINWETADNIRYGLSVRKRRVNPVQLVMAGSLRGFVAHLVLEDHKAHKGGKP